MATKMMKRKDLLVQQIGNRKGLETLVRNRVCWNTFWDVDSRVDQHGAGILSLASHPLRFESSVTDPQLIQQESYQEYAR